MLLGVLAYLVRGSGDLVQLDESVANWGDRHASAFSTDGLDVISHLGEPGVVVALAVVVAVAETVRTRSVWVVPFLLIVVAGNGILTTTVKELVDRVRPALNPIAETLGPSFPSGHSSWSAAFFAAAALLLTRGHGRAVRAAIGGGAAWLDRHGGRQPRAARRALAQRRDRGPGARLCMVLDVRHRIRWTPARVRVDRRRGRPRCDAARHRRGPGGFAGRLTARRHRLARA